MLARRWSKKAMSHDVVNWFMVALAVENWGQKKGERRP
jgi:hypothetical protein